MVQTVENHNESMLFDKKYKIIIKYNYGFDYTEMLDWVNKNSKGSVDIKFDSNATDHALYLAFEEIDDALIFKIKYSA